VPNFDARLDLMQVYATERINERILVGIQGPKLMRMVDMVTDSLVYSLHGYVLKDQGGELVSRVVTPEFAMTRKVKPRWMPKWVWNRLHEELVTETRKYNLVVRPEWTYPNATIKVPAIG
jgi:hypothetical protein